LGVLLFSGAVGFARFHADDDVRHLQSLSPVLVTEQQQIQKLTGTLSSGPFFLVHAKDDETVLQREEELAEQLRPLVVKGALSGFQSISQYIPSGCAETPKWWFEKCTTL
jgi:predicted exporter